MQTVGAEFVLTVIVHLSSPRKVVIVRVASFHFFFLALSFGVHTGIALSLYENSGIDTCSDGKLFDLAYASDDVLPSEDPCKLTGGGQVD